ncbi:helix-turn-helix domain-containing protein [Nonomuraea antri]|uniref:helix-turn-helix domain-containing protein n=1 Tax=Nonomuraea antri TaxID=2730852 RepID=UPI001C2BD9C2|nr:helix-turn-helix transcriptional regulator [Nonomuraea antri]
MRALVDVREAGLPVSGQRRRVPGLRREEVAHLAGISTDYYTRLEQGRVRTASMGVLHALGRALRLNADQQRHLVRLAQPDPGGPAVAGRQQVSPQVERLLANLVDTPALVFGRYLDILAWNRLASALLGDLAAIKPRRRNYARMIFLDPHTRALSLEWRERAQEVVSSLRLAAGIDPEQPRLRDLVTELSAHDSDFRTWWTQHLVTTRTLGRCRLSHPVVGRFDVDWQALNVPDGTDQAVVFITAPHGSASHGAIRRLDAWARSRDLRAGPVPAHPD